MRKLSKALDIIIKSYIIGLGLFTISGIILGAWGVETNINNSSLKLNLCTLIVGFIAYLLKQY